MNTIERQAAEIESLLTVEAIYWRALTDLLIGARQQSQSHADVIALVAQALHEASAFVPSNDRRAGLATEVD